MRGPAAALAFMLAWPLAAASGQTLRGLNLSGLELNGDHLPGRLSFDFVAPTQAEFAAAAAAGFTVIRLPILWERLQPQRDGALDQNAVALVRAACAGAEKYHLRVILDLHNYGVYHGATVGSPMLPAAAFAAFWGRLAAEFAADPHVAFGLMNEPHAIASTLWAQAEQDAILAIRAAGARNLVLVSGTGWDGAHDFVSGSGDGVPNAQALAAIYDPIDTLAIEAHQYLDHDFSGSHADCVTPQATRQLLAPMTDWLRAHKRRGFLGETAAAATPDCLASLAALLATVNAAPDAWAGWTYWAGGPWWGDYMFSAEQKAGHDAAQLRVLRDAARQ